VGSGRWRFSIWAPEAESVRLELGGRSIPMARYAEGYWRVEALARAGDSYMFRADATRLADPAARAQAAGVGGPSRLVDPAAYRWSGHWQGRDWDEAVIYELHLGSLTAEGTFAAAEAELPRLAALGITCIELMPVGQFPGNRGWGYDGVLPYAVHPAYGTPDEMKHFVETAQRLGMMVLLDVVYTQFGPEGFLLPKVAPVFAGGRGTWGDRIDYTRPPLRRFVIENALYWLGEYRLDGLRLDATDQITDPSDPELLVELAHALRGADFDRPIHLTTADNRNITRLHEPAADLYTAEWNDDYHHAIHCLLTAEDQGHYAAYARNPLSDLCLALAEGYVEQGQPRPPADARRGEPSAHLPYPVFINFNQNHDQTGNRAQGERLVTLAGDGPARVAHALLLLAPFTPLLFMGEERGVDSPFPFFCDYGPDMADRIRQSRRAEHPHFAAAAMPDPNDPATFAAARPRPKAPVAAEWEALTAQLLSLRRSLVVPRVKSGRAAPARALATGRRSLRAEWSFQAGWLVVLANLGAPPDRPHTDRPPRDGAPDWSLGDPAADDFALTLWAGT
jgi:malto-oligosyltrehalose trehalohydrolase